MIMSLLNSLFALSGEYGIQFDVPQTNEIMLYYVLIPILVVLSLWTLHRDKITISNRYWSGLLSMLRILFYALVAVYCFGPTFTRYVNNSRILVMIDASDSMSISDTNNISRMDQVKEIITKTEMTELLEKQHNVAIQTFGQSTKQIEMSGNSSRWLQQIQPGEPETTLCDTLANTIKAERGNPTAAIILLTDGCNNTGMTEEEFISILKPPTAVIHTVGIGKKTAPFSLRIRKEDFPKTMIVNGKYSSMLEIVTEGTLPVKENEHAKWVLDVYMVPRSSQKNGITQTNWTLPNEQKPLLSKNIEWNYAERKLVCDSQKGTTLSIPMVISPEVKGKFCFVARLYENIVGEKNTTVEYRDMVRETEVMERKEKILAFAGETNRDFQFFQSRMKRRKEVSVDYFNPEKSELNTETLSQYDVVIAMDPDWKNDFTREEILALERWVARDSGGLILTAGRLRAGQQMDSWIEANDLSVLLDLYPVRFFSNDTMIHHEMKSRDKPEQVTMTHQGMNLPFATIFAKDGKYNVNLNSTNKQAIHFDGFYTCLSVKEVKPATTLHALLSSSNNKEPANVSVGEPVLYAEQRYGSGRVFYMGNTETWRLRESTETAFDRFWIMLTRYIGQERFNRQSPFGRLWTNHDEYRPGDTVRIEAELHDRQLQPVRMDQIEATVSLPQSEKSAQNGSENQLAKKETVVLKQKNNTEGFYEGTMQVGMTGQYSLDFDVPVVHEKLTCSFAVRHGELESPPSLQNVSLLENIAKKTGGQYFDLNDPESERYLTEMANTIPPWSRELETDWDRQRIFQTIALALLCLLPLVEWTMRRWLRIL